MTPRAQMKLVQLQAAIKEQYSPPKFCKDCEWHTCRYNDNREKIIHGCTCPPLLNKITGEPSNPTANRNNAISCGPDAKYFSEKKKPTAPAPTPEPR